MSEDKWSDVIAMNELMTEGLQLMVLGMGMVFLFLGLLVGVVTLVSRTIQKYEPSTEASAGTATVADNDLIEVVTAAVKQYRSNHPR